MLPDASTLLARAFPRFSILTLPMRAFRRRRVTPSTTGWRKSTSWLPIDRSRPRSLSVRPPRSIRDSPMLTFSDKSIGTASGMSSVSLGRLSSLLPLPASIRAHHGAFDRKRIVVRGVPFWVSVSCVNSYNASENRPSTCTRPFGSPGLMSNIPSCSSTFSCIGWLVVAVADLVPGGGASAGGV